MRAQALAASSRFVRARAVVFAAGTGSATRPAELNSAFTVGLALVQHIGHEQPQVCGHSRANGWDARKRIDAKEKLLQSSPDR